MDLIYEEHSEELVTMTTNSSKPIIRAPGAGERRWFYGGGTHTWKVRAEETGGAFYVFEDEMTEGKTTPLHCHPDATEMAYVLEGEILVRIGDREERVGASGMTVAPPGVAHAFLVLSPTARILAMQTPGAGEAFYRGASEPATSDSDEGPVDFARVQQFAAQTGAVDILGPPPFEQSVPSPAN
jgi:quercetin dioxygenase-like cupin family protein